MRFTRRALSLLTAFTTTAGLAVAAAHTAQAAPLPTHVFAPYFESWTGESPATVAQQSGNKFLTMAFIQTASKGSCTAFWNGDSGMPIAQSTFGNDINTIRANGGDVIPSFGGFTADNTGTEIADSCTNVNSIAGVFQNLITTYNISRIDLDIEDNSLTNTAGIDRRNKAIKMTEDWAAANGRSIQFSYTLPTSTSGLVDSGLAVLRNAVTNNARIDVVNIMTFDYFDNASHNMASDTQTAGNGLVSQLGQLFPGRTQAQLWGMVGITEMIGIDDFGPAETFTTDNAPTVFNWAVSKGINTLSFWALQRDNGSCPGTKGADNCSGVAQSTWQFSHVFEQFTGGNPTPGNDFSLSVNPGSAAVNPGGSTSATVATAVTSGSAQSVALTVSGTPTGVNASVSPGSVTAGGSASLSISTTSAAPPGIYALNIHGAATSGSHDTTFTLTINGSTPSGGIVNAGFESGALAPWTATGDSVVSTPVHSGTRALQVNATSSATGEADQTVTLQPNHAYTLKAWVQGNFAFIGVSGGASGQTWVSSASYTQASLAFTTGASGTVTVFVHGWYGQGTVFADDFTIS
ncbi:glycosyl hydrolase family 18 protein [Actinocrispum wychmicini]|uniref:chitinase n=1 Tax=Actinocrispum wychmicini TaxID=1213861 RepID=A0A4R2JC16_9PSEU|nr:glycosyl hydrolase family 18 protein [Actinocrispum wychmicini]TCO53639.1 carbohydrate binding protein [Actinocrispum wychmicini]